MCFPSHLVGAFLPNRMDPRLLRFRPKNGFSRFLTIFDTFFVFFQFCIFSILVIFDFLVFVTFSVFLIFSILMIFWFWWFLSDFCCWHQFWSFFVSNLGASMMTHFSPSIPALPLSPILVVKFDHIFDLWFWVNFWSIFGHFWSIWVKNSILPLKTHFFDLIFDQFSVKFWPFFDPFLGFFGGYPSPSISAPLVVKKCPKLYIYNIGDGMPLP